MVGCGPAHEERAPKMAATGSTAIVTRPCMSHVNQNSYVITRGGVEWSNLDPSFTLDRNGIMKGGSWGKGLEP